ncbi:MAG: hypothetical protein HY826_10390 [Actinobacteria bacterium]|nr:hypothetical protein [Actinomycetota bacterium]
MIKKTDLHKAAVDGNTEQDETSVKTEVNSAPARLPSLSEFRARLDVPLFHRDQGLAQSAQLPRLLEIRRDQAVEPVVQEPVAPETVVPEPVVATSPVVDRPARSRPMLASIADLLSASEAVVVPVEPAPVAPPAEPVVPPTVDQSEVHALSTETDALLEVLAGFQVPAEDVVVETAIPEPIAPTPPSAATDAPWSTSNGSDEVRINSALGHRSVESELDRLAFLPDAEEVVGRVIVPVIAPTGQRHTVAVPVLSQHEMYNPRVIVTPVGKPKLFDAFDDNLPSKRKRRKGSFRRFFSLVVVLCVVGGGLYVAKYYLLAPKWSSADKVLVDEVETARQLEFDHAVDVNVVGADAYAERLGTYSLGVSSSNRESVTGELRALGLLSGEVDLHAIGLAAIVETPAFYDAGEEEIYVVADLPAATHRFAMHRALASALLDQEYGWGRRAAGGAPTVSRGTRALYEADALATATGLLTAADRASVLEQQPILSSTIGVIASPSPFGTAMAGHIGVALRAYVESVPLADRAAILRNATITDGQALDLRRLVSGAVEIPSVGSEGMLFWYHVLAGRLDPATAWNNALALQRDDVSVTKGASGYCVTAVLTVTASVFDNVTAAFLAWAGAAPAESLTTVTASNVDGLAQVSVNACDPGNSVQTNGGLTTLSMGGAPLRSEQYRQLVSTQPTLAKSQVACAVYAGDNVSSADERAVVDGVDGWAAPTAHPIPDPNRADCLQP